jgi:hypothetical protein
MDGSIAEHARLNGGVTLSRHRDAGKFDELLVGRGTDVPFEVIGAEFIQGRQLAEYLNARQIPD